MRKTIITEVNSPFYGAGFEDSCRVDRIDVSRDVGNDHDVRTANRFIWNLHKGQGYHALIVGIAFAQVRPAVAADNQ